MKQLGFSSPSPRSRRKAFAQATATSYLVRSSALSSASRTIVSADMPMSSTRGVRVFAPHLEQKKNVCELSTASRMASRSWGWPFRQATIGSRPFRQGGVSESVRRRLERACACRRPRPSYRTARVRSHLRAGRSDGSRRFHPVPAHTALGFANGRRCGRGWCSPSWTTNAA
jgi:hypothetical protein